MHIETTSHVVHGCSLIKPVRLPSSNMYQLKDQNSSSHETALFQLVNEDVAENPVLKDVMVSFQSLVIADKIGNGKT